MSSLYARWTLANALALGLGIAVIRLALPTFSGDEFLQGRASQTVGLLVATALPVTLALGGAQAWAVRPAVPASQAWLTRTVLGTLVGWPLGVLAGVVVALLLNAVFAVLGVTPADLGLGAVRNGIAALIGAVIGATQGGCQARLLAEIPLPRRAWVGASALGGAIGFVLMLALLLGFDPAAQTASAPLRLATAFAAGAVGGAAGSAVSGLWLRRLRADPGPRTKDQ